MNLTIQCIKIIPTSIGKLVKLSSGVWSYPTRHLSKKTNWQTTGEQVHALEELTMLSSHKIPLTLDQRRTKPKDSSISGQSSWRWLNVPIQTYTDHMHKFGNKAGKLLLRLSKGTCQLTHIAALRDTQGVVRSSLLEVNKIHTRPFSWIKVWYRCWGQKQSKRNVVASIFFPCIWLCITFKVKHHKVLYAKCCLPVILEPNIVRTQFTIGSTIMSTLHA